MFDMLSLTCLACNMGAWHLFSLFFFVFKSDFDHGMMTCRDMFDMFSLTCLACNMWRGTVFQSTFVCSEARI